jgi:hypothetical protein
MSEPTQAELAKAALAFMKAFGLGGRARAYTPKVRANRYGDRNKYTPEKCRQLCAERGVGKRREA